MKQSVELVSLGWQNQREALFGDFPDPHQNDSSTKVSEKKMCSEAANEALWLLGNANPLTARMTMHYDHGLCLKIAYFSI